MSSVVPDPALNDWVPMWQLAPARLAYGLPAGLPASPVDGQEYVMVDSTTNPNYQWHLRYNASSTSTYKWEFVGGAEFSGYSAANVNLGSTVNTFANIVGGSTIAIPRSGEYILRSKCVAVNAAAATFYTVLWFGSLSSTVGDQSQAGVSAAGGWSTELITGPYKGILAGGNGLGVAGQCNAVNGSFQQITWSMIPVRVS